MGKLKHTKDKFENINWTTDVVKYLGVYFGYEKNKYMKLNAEKQLLKSVKILNMWKKWKLTMIGKVTVMKSLIIPNIIYIASVLDIDNETIIKF